eukprot:31707-Hanusia_phi.AAC.1
MVVKSPLSPNLIDAEVLTGCGAGERVFIPGPESLLSHRVNDRTRRAGLPGCRRRSRTVPGQASFRDDHQQESGADVQPLA